MKTDYSLGSIKRQDLDLLPEDEWTPLMAAVRDYARDLSKMLVQTSFDVVFVDSGREWPFDLDDLPVFVENGTPVIIMGTDWLDLGLDSDGLALLMLALLLVFGEYLAEKEGLDAMGALPIMAARLDAVLDQNPDALAAAEAKFWLAA